MKKSGWVAAILVLLAFPLQAKEFANSEKHYAFQYDESNFELISPGLLGTDAVVRKKKDEHGFFPNLIVISREVNPGATLQSEVAKAKGEYQKIFPQMDMSREESFAFKGYPGYLMELSYKREDYRLFLRAILIQTPRLFVTLNLTSPLDTKDANLAAFVSILNTLTLEKDSVK